MIIETTLIEQALKFLFSLPKRILIMLYLAASLIFFAIQLVPMLQSEAQLLGAVMSSSRQEFEEFKAEVVREGPAPQTYTSERTFPITSLVSALISVRAERDVSGSARVTSVSVKAQRRNDNLVLFLSVWLVGGLILASISKETIQAAVLSPDAPHPAPSPAGAGGGAVPADAQASEYGTTESVLISSVVGVQARAEALFFRSTLLLGGGILMAFIGVTLFYITLPPYSNDEAPLSYLPKAIRPTGMLIFVEGIAWFLLRQYRVLVEDYKSFHRVYLKRSNYLAVLKLINDAEVKPERLILATSLLQEDLTGVIKKEDTTEALEQWKVVDSPPFLQIINKILDRDLLKAKSSEKE